MIYNLIDIFNREVEILDIKDGIIYYALDQKSEKGNRCEIRRYSLTSRADDFLLQIENTRIYESFDTFNCNEDYFYAISVSDQYDINLNCISKEKWSVEKQYILKAEGEILKIYPINKEYLLVVDEVLATDEILEAVDNEDYRGKYYQLIYIYQLNTKKKYYLNQMLKRMNLEDAVVLKADVEYLCLTLNSDGYIKWLYLDCEDMHEKLKENRSLIFEKISFPVECTSIMSLKRNKDQVIYELHNKDGQVIIGQIDLKGTVLSGTAQRIYPDTKNSEFVFDTNHMMAYQITEKEEQYYVKSLDQTDWQYQYPSEYGEWSGLCDINTGVSSFYQTKMLREDIVFKECVAVHHILEDRIETYEGKFVKKGNDLILLRSFLFL